MLVWLVVAGVLGHPGLGSAVAHGAAGALIGWTVVPLLAPSGRPRVVASAVVVTFIVGGAWEIAELCADALLGTDLSAGAGDTALDLVADVLGALIGAALAIAMSNRRTSRQRASWRGRGGATPRP